MSKLKWIREINLLLKETEWPIEILFPLLLSGGWLDTWNVTSFTNKIRDNRTLAGKKMKTRRK